MGNNCVGTGRSNEKDGLLGPISSIVFCNKSSHDSVSTDRVVHISPKLTNQIQPGNLSKRVMQLNSSTMLQTTTNQFPEIFSLGRRIGQGRFGTVYLCVENSTGKEYACKLVDKRRLVKDEDVEDLAREIQILCRLSGHPNVASIKEAYEDSETVRIVMELCTGGQLLDRIKQQGNFAEKKAAGFIRTIVEVVEHIHSIGIMHRDLKPENFLFVDHEEDSILKAIDFGLSAFFRPGELFDEVVGSQYYVAPEVLSRNYGPEADVWSAGVILYILLSGKPPFWGKTEQDIFNQVLYGEIELLSHPWPVVSVNAKNLVRKMLDRNPVTRITATEVLCHPWIMVNSIGLDRSI